METSWIVQYGAVELALGAVSGWLVMLAVDRPELLKRIGVVAPVRLRQAHIDLIMMGTILIALGLAAPDLPAPWSILLVAGATVNPLLFIPLAFNAKLQKALPYRAVTGLSFIAMTTGTVAAAVYLLSQ